MNLRGILQWLLRDARRPLPLSLIIFAIVVGGLGYAAYYFNLDPHNAWLDKAAVAALIIYAPLFIYGLLHRLLSIWATAFHDVSDLITGNRNGDDDGR